MVKRILVPLDLSPYSAAALNQACLIAKKLDAEITGLVILDIPGIEKSIGPIPMGGLYYAEHLEKTKLEDAENRIHTLLTKFENQCKKAGVRYKRAERQGTPSNQILKESVYYDAIIMGIRTFFHFESQDKAGDSLEKIMDDSITPIFAVPSYDIAPVSINEEARVLITFDGSLPSARALQRFVQFGLPEDMEITILNSSEDEANSGYLLAEAEDYLKSHGFVKIKKDWTTEPIIDVIENRYFNKIDVIVLGIHSKKKILQFVLGSLTKRLIKQGTKVLFIGQ
jgi:nucleotide-binding universal stress UspA family protein